MTAFIDENKSLVSNPNLRRRVIERALVVNLKAGKDLCDALQVAKSLAKTIFHSRDVKFTDILRVTPRKYVVLVKVVQNGDVAIEKYEA